MAHAREHAARHVNHLKRARLVDCKIARCDYSASTRTRGRAGVGRVCRHTRLSRRRIMVCGARYMPHCRKLARRRAQLRPLTLRILRRMMAVSSLSAVPIILQIFRYQCWFQVPATWPFTAAAVLNSLTGAVQTTCAFSTFAMWWHRETIVILAQWHTAPAISRHCRGRWLAAGVLHRR